MTTKSLADYDQVIQLDPNDAAAYYNRGDAKSALDDKQSAIQDYKKAADLYKQQGKTFLYQLAVDNMKKLSKQ
ncbi:tetratricopeptide repeat protein [Microcoleus sp. herbarium8]|uniref:tetratricopeptide repeat protein n=1 Tax=Microcoleus sp. herbarium8 TaxID=3055436 RepID=UPI002FD5EFAA